MSRNVNNCHETSGNVIQGTARTLLSSIPALRTERSQARDVTETGVFGTKAGGDSDSTEHSRHVSRLSEVLQKLSEYRSAQQQQPEGESGRVLVGSLENELADIIALFQDERTTQAQEIARLHAEVGRLNSVLSFRPPILAPSSRKESVTSSGSVQEAKIKGLEELLHKLHRECFDSRSQVLQLQEVIKEKDRQIEELRRGSIKDSSRGKENVADLASERNYRKLQAEIGSLKAAMESKGREVAECRRYDSATRNAKLEKSLRTAREESGRLGAALRQRDDEIAGLKRRLDVRVASVDLRASRDLEGLIGKVQNLETYIQKGQDENHRKMQEYLEYIRELEREIQSQRRGSGSRDRLCQEVKDLKSIMLDMEQKCSVQASCGRSLQDAIQFLVSGQSQATQNPAARPPQSAECVTCAHPLEEKTADISFSPLTGRSSAASVAAAYNRGPPRSPFVAPFVRPKAEVQF